MVEELVKNMALKEKSEAILKKAHINGVDIHPTPCISVDSIHSIPDNLLGTYYSQYESYSGWLSYCLTRRTSDLEMAEILLKRLEAKLYLELKTKEKTDKIINAEIATNDEYIMYENEIQQIKTDVNMLKAILKDAEGKARAFSREITTRMSGGVPRNSGGF